MLAKQYNITIICALNITTPLLFGCLFYYIFWPDVLFVHFLDLLLESDYHILLDDTGSVSFRLLRNYLLDFLWAYALTFSIFILYGSNTAATLKTIFLIAFCFSAILEILQCTSFVPGTFDVLDILTEIFGIASAVFIIRKVKIKQGEEEPLHER